MPIHVRALRPDEVVPYLQVVNAAIQGVPLGHYPASIIEAWVVPLSDVSVAAIAANPDGEVRVAAEVDGALIGVGAVVPHLEELRACYVVPAAARRGVGSAIVAELERIALAHDVHHLTVVASLNAEPFYAALGYERVRHGGVALRHGHVIPAIWMRRALGHQSS